MPDNESNRTISGRPAPRHFRILLSSPGDVWEERELARRLIKDKLSYKPFLRDRVTFDVVSWEDPHARTPMLGTLTPQECVNCFGPKPSDCDIVVVLFWARMGTPLPETYRKASGERYLSGTEWEYEDAINAAGSLDLLIYRRKDVPLIPYDDPERVERQRQFDLVEQFFEKFRAADGSLLRSFTAYDKPADFEKLLADDLERILRWRLGAEYPQGITPHNLHRPENPEIVPPNTYPHVAPAEFKKGRPSVLDMLLITVMLILMVIGFYAINFNNTKIWENDIGLCVALGIVFYAIVWLSLPIIRKYDFYYNFIRATFYLYAVLFALTLVYAFVALW